MELADVSGKNYLHWGKFLFFHLVVMRRVLIVLFSHIGMSHLAFPTKNALNTKNISQLKVLLCLFQETNKYHMNSAVYLHKNN